MTTNKNNNKDDPSSSSSSLPDLRSLLNALAVGARAVHSLPLSSSSTTPHDDSDSNNNDPNDDSEEDDEFQFQMAFPEFKSLCLSTRTLLTTLLSQSLLTLQETSEDQRPLVEYEFEDVQLWQEAADACEVLMERVEQYIQSKKEGRVGLEEGVEELQQVVRDTKEHVYTRAKNGYRDMMNGIVDMEVGTLVLKNKHSIECFNSLFLKCRNHKNVINFRT